MTTCLWRLQQEATVSLSTVMATQTELVQSCYSQTFSELRTLFPAGHDLIMDCELWIMEKHFTRLIKLRVTGDVNNKCLLGMFVHF